MKLIEERQGPNTSKPTYFVPTLHTPVIKRLILETCSEPHVSHLDPRTSKKLHRYRRYPRAVGRDVEGRECFWLLVIAKRNSWITASYPVLEPNERK